MKEGNFLSMFLQLHLYFPFFMWSDQVFFKSAISSNEEINSGMNDNGNPSMVHRPWKHPNEFIVMEHIEVLFVYFQIVNLWIN